MAVRGSFGGQALLGAADQALLALAHFLLGVLVARCGGLAALGAFAFAYALIVLVNMVHQALIAEVYSVVSEASAGATRYGALPIVLVTLGLVLIAVVVIGVASLVVSDIRAQAWTLAFLCALLASSCYWSVKPYYYRHSRPRVVLASTMVYGVGMLCSAAIGYAWLGPRWEPMWSIALGALLASTPLWRALKTCDAGYVPHMRRYLATSLRYAAWAVPAAVLIWINSNGYLFTIPLWGDPAQSGALRAVLNLVAPINTLLVGACSAWLPVLAWQFQAGDARAYQWRVHKVAACLCGVTLLGGLLVALFSSWLIQRIYGERYMDFAPALQWAVLLPALWVVTSVYRAAIRARADTLDLFKAYAFALFPVGIGLMAWLSEQGAAAAIKGMLVTQLLVVVAFVYLFTRRTGPTS